eukprot:6039264-Lingulodinium_polyedra.AAC.1
MLSTGASVCSRVKRCLGVACRQVHVATVTKRVRLLYWQKVVERAARPVAQGLEICGLKA